MTKLFSKSIQFIFISLLLLSSTMCIAQDITGKWYGNPEIHNGMTLPLIFDIEKEGDTYKAFMLSPEQTNQKIDAETVTYADSVLTITIPSIRFSYTGTVKGDEIHGAFSQNGGRFTLNLSKQALEFKRPQEPKPPYPYDTEDVTFYNDKGKINLAGTFSFPRGSHKSTAVVLVTGSGKQNRDEELMGHKPFAVLADYLTRQGIAVLRYDDRGAGSSEGDFASSTITDFASDAYAAVEYLKARPEVDSGKVGLIGHSEGGCVAFILASEQLLPFIVTLAGPGIDGSSILSTQQEVLLSKSGMPEEMVTQYVETMSKVQHLVATVDDKEELENGIKAAIHNTILAFQADKLIQQVTAPAMVGLIKFDPAHYFPSITCPVFALNGGKDVQVIAGANLEAIEKGLKKAGNNRVKTKEYPQLNHLFQTSGTGMPEEYREIEETFNEEVMKDIVDWIRNIGF